MRWTHDLTVGALYFEVSDAPVTRQREVAPGLIVDLDASDQIVGIEVLGQKGRDALLRRASEMNLSETDIELIVAVIAFEVIGDRQRLGMSSRPPVESHDDSLRVELQDA